MAFSNPPEPLFSYQQEAVDRIIEDGMNYLAFEQGLGKTRTAIEVAKRLKAKRVLIICPATVKLVWEAQIRKWWPEAPKVTVIDKPLSPGAVRGRGVWVINYDKLSQSRSNYDFTATLRAIGKAEPFTLTVLDEAHFLSNPGAIRTKAVYKTLLPYLGRVLAMSGTPANSHAGQLYTAIRALAPETITGPTGFVMPLQQFEDLYCTVVEKRFGDRRIRVIEGSKNLPALRAKLETFMIRKTKKECLPDLPDLIFDTLPVAPSAHGLDALKQYEAILRPGMTDEEVMRSLQTADEHVMRLRAALGLAKVAPAVAYLDDWLRDNEDEKIVVWANHTAVIDKAVAGLANFHPVKIDGRDGQKDRARAVETFLEDPKCRVAVLNIVAAGTGLTLIGPKCRCSNCFFVESSYVPADNFQAAARIHRIGTKDNVLVRFFVAHGTLDVRIQAIVARKTADLAQLFA